VLRSGITLELEVHLPAHELSRAGDLDNFVTGVCDGLQASSGESPRDPRWFDPANASLDPAGAILIENDAAVIEIHASKREERTSVPWHKVTLTGTPSK
jgi:hypothetical protein